jgi:thymidylate synthase (FAD)
MRILKESKTYVICRPQIVEEGVRAFLEDQGLEWPTPIAGVTDAARLVELAGRCCYMSFGAKAGSKTNQKYIDNLIGLERPGPAHGSVVEHPTWSFLTVGAGRGFSHEQVRHRVGVAYSQLSTRYCDFEREDVEGSWDPGFVIPPMAQLSGETSQFMADKLKQSQETYTDLLHRIEADLEASPEFAAQLAKMPERQARTALRKAARGAARDILPIATEAIMTMSFNARSIWNMAVMRASEHAEGAIRAVYVQILKIMEKEFPELFHAIEYTPVWDGSLAAKLRRDKL